MTRLGWSLLAAICASAPVTVHAQSSAERCARQTRAADLYRQEAYRMGLEAERVREVYSIVDCNMGLVSSWAQRSGVQEALLIAVTRELGLRRGATQAEIIASIEGLAKQVGTLNSEIAGLSTKLLTTDAQRDLARIEALLKSGNLDGAAEAFGELNTRLINDSLTGSETFAALIRAQAQLAYARGDMEEGWRIANSGVKIRARQRQAREQARIKSLDFDRREDLQAFITHASQLYERGTLFQNADDLMQSVSIFDNDALRLAPRETAAADWANVQNRLGLVKRSLGGLVRDPKVLNQAIVHFGASLEIYPKDIVIRHNLATVLIEIAKLEGRTDRLIESRVILAQLYYTVDARSDPALYTMITTTFGEATGFLGSSTRDPALLDRAVHLFESVLSNSPNGPSSNEDQFTWAETQRNLGRTLFSLAVIKKDPEMFRRSETASARSQIVNTYAIAPAVWRDIEYSRALALEMRGYFEENGMPHLKAAESALRALLALTDHTQDAARWTRINDSLSHVRGTIADIELGKGLR